MGVSLGKPGATTTTRSGTKVIMSRHESYRMRSSTLGPAYSGDSYDLVVPYAMRMTWSGEFLHGADYNANIGRANTSHGCTNLRSSDARWLYESSLVGDPVVTTGTDRWMEEGNGLGGAWNVDWERWTSRSAA
jgi:lipoprotein-anchoring transpeptidase ErfK/SrfK